MRVFVAEAGAWPLARRAEVTEWLLALELAHPKAYDLVPYPLRSALIEPTLAAWAASAPGDPGPWRWLPAPDGPRHALTLEAGDQIARFRLAAWAAEYLEYASHELPAGYLGGDPAADRSLAEEALAAARGLADAGRGMHSVRRSPTTPRSSGATPRIARATRTRASRSG